MPKYHVTVKAFDRISARNIEAEDVNEAEARMLDEVHFSIESKRVFESREEEARA